MFDIVEHLIGRGYVTASFKYVMEIISTIDAVVSTENIVLVMVGRD